MISLRVYHRLPRITTLGPGVRFCIWVQGCRRRCPGCLSPDSRPFDGGELLSVDELAEEINSTTDINGLTISGGEPFEQAPALFNLLLAVKRHRDLGVIIYTGYRMEELQLLASPENCYSDLLACTDLLIDGPYEAELNDGRSLRGSSNQRALVLTDRYAEFVQSLYGVGGRKVEMFLDATEHSYAGIPPASFLRVWQDQKERKDP